ncbi:MAG: FAD-binding oxidoreductase [Alphaproteobacteria bacterium]|nr:FAD-binding oxidoreductase [Alphaproteobacteria bacterium]
MPPHTADVIILGAGIAGASAAYELAATHRVLLLERESQPGLHATGRSAAIFSEIYGNAVVRGLSRASRAFLFSPPQGFAGAPLVSPRATLFVAPTEQVEALHAMRRDADVAAGTEPLSVEEALARVPILRRDRVAEALYEPGASDIDVNALHQGFLRGFKARGGTLVCAVRIQALDRKSKTWRAIAGDDIYEAPIVVNATGAWADETAKLAGARPIGIEPKRRTVALIDPPAGVDSRAWPLTIDADETFYFKPDAGRILVTPADETPSPPCDAQPEEIDIALAIDRFESMTTMNVRRVVHKWAGLRTFARDKTPVVGFDPYTDGFFWLAGQGGYGMQTSSAMARTAAALVRGEDLPQDIRAEGVTAVALSPQRLHQ